MYAAVSFSDLSSGHWAYKYITELAEQKVINGYTDGTFRPKGTVTRGEFLKLAMVSALTSGGQELDLTDAESAFNHWAGQYVWIARQYGIISTSDITRENIDQPITRIEMVRIITKLDWAKGNEFAQDKQLIFSDVRMLSKTDIDYLKHAYSRGLITGYEDGTFGPEKNMNRAEAATMIYRFSK